MKKNCFAVCGICLLLACVGIFASCTDYEAMYDDNEKIASSNSYMFKKAKQNHTAGNFQLSCDGFSGVYEVDGKFAVNADSNIDYNCTLTSGKIKLVLTTGEDVYLLAEGEHTGTVPLTDIPAGTYHLKLVGAKAEVELQVEYDE